MEIEAEREIKIQILIEIEIESDGGRDRDRNDRCKWVDRQTETCVDRQTRAKETRDGRVFLFS